MAKTGQSKRGRDVSMEKSPSPGRDNVSIFPIQLLNSNASLPLTSIPFPEADFEDCSFYINSNLLCRRLRTDTISQGRHNGTHYTASPSDEEDEDITFVGISNGKRKVDFESTTDSKRPKLEAQNLLSLPATACHFDVLSHSGFSGKGLANLLEAKAGQSVSIKISKMEVRSLLNREEDSWITTALDVYEGSEIVATLPIVDTDKIPFERDPHRYTNGKWLESMVALSGNLVGENDSSPLQVFIDFKIGEKSSNSQGGNRFTLELHLSMSLSLAKLSPITPSSPPWLADHLHRLIRFCYPNDDFEKLVRSRGNLTANTVYSLLLSSQLPALDELQPSQLEPSLFPFQKRSVNFLLGREGKKYIGVDDEGKPIVGDIEGAMTCKGLQKLGLWWQRLEDYVYYNALMGKLTRNRADTLRDQVQGGILAEEMGLGKTVEVLALILLNRDEARSQLPSYYDVEHELDISPTKTTLIVAPETLRQQWLDEIALHAPHLHVFSYLGYSEAAKQVPKGMVWQEYARGFDVMVVSFDTLRKEINVARKAPDRSRRFVRKYERPRSLLIQLSFHRVVMDEVQLMGHTQAAETVSMIDRHYSLAVSGTPVKAINDLNSLFHFLRVLNASTNRHWDRLLTPALLPSLAACFNMLATRHTKAQVRSEMTLPAQTRVLVPIAFTAIEAAFYRDIYSKAFDGTGVDPTDSESIKNLLHRLRARSYENFGWLQQSLVSLRQACTHPQIAGSQARSGHYSGTALATSNTIRSMDEVLTIMIEGTKSDEALHWQQLVRKQIDRAVLLLQDKRNEARLEIAKEMLSSVAVVIEEKAKGVTEDWERAMYVGPLYRFAKSEVEATRRQINDGINGMESDHINNISEDLNSEVAEKKLYRNRQMMNLGGRWTLFTEQLHRAFHFLGNTYFQLGEKRKAIEAEQMKDAKNLDEEAARDTQIGSTSPEVVRLKKEEERTYARAEEVRQELVKFERKNVELTLAMLDRAPHALDFALQELMVDVDFGKSGIFTITLFDRLNEIQDLLNRQTEVLCKWRDEILQRIRKPVSRDVSDEDENDDQYQENLDAQSEAEVLTEMYRVLLHERDFFITGMRVEGSTSKPALFVELERVIRTQKRLEFLQLSNPDDENVVRQLKTAPTQESLDVMKLQLDHFRKLEKEKSVFVYEEVDLRQIVEEDVLQYSGSRRRNEKDKNNERLNPDNALETVLKELRERQHQHDKETEEGEIIRMSIEKLRPLISSQRTKTEKLKREHLSFMAVFNARSTYFKRMQALSDDVADKETSNIRKEIQSIENEEVTLKRRIEAVAGRLRYLHAIEEEEEEVGEGDSTPDSNKENSSNTRTCYICTEPLINAVIFNTCGHSTCEDCFKNWTLKRGQCPMCKTKVMLRDVYRVTYGRDGKGKKREVRIPLAEKRKRQQERYNVISEDLVRSMTVMPIMSALGSKLNLLTRHLLYLEQIKPGTKSLIFTAFSRGITLVGNALRLNNIKHVTLDQGGQRGSRIIDTFKNSPSVHVLLLHSEAQSSGLNLTCAENVFLLEPLVNHSIELQAIGRVHRIGQNRETTVFVYQVNDTVEEKIVELATSRDQSLITRENCISTDLKDSAAMAAKMQEGVVRSKTRTKEGEFVASIEEVFQCLFDDEEQGQTRQRNDEAAVASTSVSSTSSPIKQEEERREQMRKERLEAIERRQALASIERERDQQHR